MSVIFQKHHLDDQKMWTCCGHAVYYVKGSALIDSCGWVRERPWPTSSLGAICRAREGEACENSTLCNKLKSLETQCS